MSRRGTAQMFGQSQQISTTEELGVSGANSGANRLGREEVHGIAKRCSSVSVALPEPPMPRPDISNQRLPRYLTQEEVRDFFASIENPRDRTLFFVVYLYGLRVAEVGLLYVSDVDLIRGRIIVRRLKGGAWAERPLFSRVRELLEAHLLTLEDSRPEAPLFPGIGGALRKRQIQSLFTRYRDAAGIARSASCHSLRHSIATHLLDAGVSLEFVQDHLGHQSIRSTSIYARITDQHRAAIFRDLETSPWIVQPERMDRPSPSERLPSDPEALRASLGIHAGRAAVRPAMGAATQSSPKPPEGGRT